MARWSQSSRKLLSDSLVLLKGSLKRVLSRRCSHIAGHVGMKGTVKQLTEQIGAFRFAARFGIASYYESIHHHILLALLAKTRWSLKCAIRELRRAITGLGLELHKEKRFIGRTDNGLDFL